MGRWQRYWFAEGGRISAAIIRIALACSVLLSLRMLQGELAAQASIYRPIGIWMLLGRTPPPELLVDLLWIVAWAGALAMLVGAWTRAATAISCAAGIALAALFYAGRVTWSHEFNVVFIAQIAFLGARGGDALSIDAWLRRRRGLPPLDVPRGYQWSVRLVLLAVAIMFVSAVFCKLRAGQFTLRWALTDNLRHLLLIRYDLAGLDRPALVDWLLADVWRYRTAAVLNLVSQLAPLFALVFVRRPLVRAFAGACFFIEVLALGLVMSMWDFQWMPLAAVFVDWDRVAAAIARWRGAPLPAPAAAPASWRPPWRARVFVVAFVAYVIATSLVPTIDQKLNTYPFSGYPMFSWPIRAARPYDQHLPYGVMSSHYEAISDRPLEARAQRWLDHENRNLHTVRDAAQLRVRLTAILERARATYPEYGIRGLRHYIALFVAPAYPAPARFTRHDLARTAELLPDGTFRTVFGKFTKSGVTLAPQHVDASAARFSYYANDRLESHELGGVRSGDAITVDLAAGTAYVVAEIDGQRWLVAWRRGRNW